MPPRSTAASAAPTKSILPSPALSVLRLVNGSTGDPTLYCDFPGEHNALLFDAGENHQLSAAEIRDIAAVFLTHHHFDHFFGFDRVLRYNLDADKTIDIFGPQDTIARVQGKLAAYAYQRFAFQKLAFRIHEIAPDGMRTTTVRATNGFTPGRVTTRAKIPRVLFSQRECRVRWTFGDHTVPCLAYAVELTAGHRYDPEKAAHGTLKPGPWIGRVLAELDRPARERAKTIDINGGRFTLAELSKRYFRKLGRTTIGFLTDTRYSPESLERYTALFSGAARLYCDCYYHPKQAVAAQEHGHLTAEQSGRLGARLEVQELFLMHFGSRYRGRYDELIEIARQYHPRVLADVSQA